MRKVRIAAEKMSRYTFASSRRFEVERLSTDGGAAMCHRVKKWPQDYIGKMIWNSRESRRLPKQIFGECTHLAAQGDRWRAKMGGGNDAVGCAPALLALRSGAIWLDDG